jgi:hypothetical protein
MMEMERSPFLPLPEGMVIGQVEITAAQLTVEVISTQPSAAVLSVGVPQSMSIVNTSERFTTSPVEVAMSCYGSVCTSFLAGQQHAPEKSLPSGFLIWCRILGIPSRETKGRHPRFFLLKRILDAAPA